MILCLLICLLKAFFSISYCWKLLIPKNVAVFIWRVSLERLPTMDNLAK